MHMATTHMVVGDIMAMDTRIGMEAVMAKLYPGVEYKGAIEDVSVKKEAGDMKSEATPVRRKRGPASGVQVEVQQVFRPLSSQPFSRDEEAVDDPTPVSPPRIRLPTKSESKTENSPPLPTPRIDRVHNCIVCGGQGKANKEGRNLNMGEGLQDMKYHYAVCYYNQGVFRDLVDPGELNITLGGEPLEEFGIRFKYKCPFVTCSRNTGRGAPGGEDDGIQRVQHSLRGGTSLAGEGDGH